MLCGSRRYSVSASWSVRVRPTTAVCPQPAKDAATAATSTDVHSRAPRAARSLRVRNMGLRLNGVPLRGHEADTPPAAVAAMKRIPLYDLRLHEPGCEGPPLDDRIDHRRDRRDGMRHRADQAREIESALPGSGAVLAALLGLPHALVRRHARLGDGRALARGHQRPEFQRALRAARDPGAVRNRERRLLRS